MIGTAQIQSVLNELDLEGLLLVGAPKDEYEPEARAIAERIYEHADEVTESRISLLIIEVWCEKFGPFSPEQLKLRRPAIAEAARRIHHLRPQ